MTKITGRISSDAPLIRTIISGAGPKGQSVEYVWVGTQLGLKMEGDEEFMFVDLKGDSIELQVNAEYIQWKNSTDAEWQNLIPLADLKGERGFTGEQGEQGEQGPKGDDGEIGPKGDTGEQGEQGPKGDDGEIGPKGDTGEQGEQGPKGDDGEIGPKGDTGEQGEQGPKGDDGEIGPKGDTGEQGEQGPKGADGLTTAVKVGSTQYNHTGGIVSLPAYPTALPADGGDADTVNGKTVGTNVPAGAVFTDTKTTINGKTGEISKDDIVALGIPAQDTVVDITGKQDKLIAGTNVSITGNTISATDTIVDISGKADKSQVLTNVPENAKFTDTNTVTSINGKTGVIEKADIVALGIPAQDTNTTYTAGTNIAITGNTISATDTVVDVSGKADKTYVDGKVKTDVPVDAKFTDTVYSHPPTHPASMITDLPTGKKVARFVVGTSTAGWTAADCDYLCDGIADQVEINNAITALPAKGGEIVILDGAYYISATIDVTKNNVSIRGNGNATILRRMFNSASAEGVITLTGRSDCKIADLQVDGSKSSYTQLYNHGIYLDSSNNNTITGNTCNNNRSSGIHLLDSSRNAVTGNACNNNNNYGIYLFNSSNNTTIGNIFNDNGSGITLALSSNSNIVTGNTCNNNNNSGIYLFNSSNNTITGNACIRGTGLATDYTASQHAIQLMGTANNYNLISNNNCMGKAPKVDGGTGNSVYGNKYDSGDYKDFTQDEKTKLAGISEEANKYTHPSTHPASMITGLPNSLPADGGNADTVGGFTVGVNVPANAKFTDTITSINGKTGTIVKADIVALGIPAQDTVVDISGKQDKLIAGTNISITGTTISATDTNTVTSINGKTGVIEKADIVALGIPAQDTNTTYTAGTNIAITGNTISATDTVVDVSGKADKTYVDNKVKTDVPTDAKFTDTTYTAGTNITITDNIISSEGGGGGTVDIADNLTTDDATKALSATQGKILDEKSPNKESYVPHGTKTNHATGNAEGYRTTASGYASHAEGYQTTASGYASHAEGYQTTASGNYSHAEGAGTTASGDTSHAEGYYTTASGYASHAEGYQTTASGNYSHAEGYYTTASGNYSHAEGRYTTANGYYSHAEGRYTTANGYYSHAQNERTIAQGEAQTAIGKYNIPQGADDWITPDDHAFIIGNGTDEDSRSNALTVNWQGDVDIAGDYKINGNVMVEPTITTAWEKFEIETITASVAMSAPMGGGINLNVSAGGVFDWVVGDKVISASIVTDGAGTIAPELENPLTITSFEEMGFDITGTNASLYPVGDDFMPLVIGNTTHPQLGEIGAFVTYGVDGTSVTVEVLRNPIVVYSDDADAYPDSGQVGDYYYVKMSPVRGLESRVTDLEARLLALENK